MNFIDILLYLASGKFNLATPFMYSILSTNYPYRMDCKVLINETIIYYFIYIKTGDISFIIHRYIQFS